MRAFLLSMLLSVSLWTPAQAQDDPISTVIEDQLDAFRADDFDTAFTFASPMIRDMFGNAANFEAMVRNGYPMVHRPGRVTYLDQQTDDGRTFQDVEIFDQAGRAHYLRYEMVETPYGWQINGVRFIPQPSIGA